MKIQLAQSFDYINQMVEETFSNSLVVESEQLEFDFNLTNHVEQIMSYNAQKCCYLLMIGKTTLEIPQNWGIFNDIHQQRSEYFLLDASGDSYRFLEIVGSLLNQNVSKLVFKHLKSQFLLEIIFADDFVLAA